MCSFPDDLKTDTEIVVDEFVPHSSDETPWNFGILFCQLPPVKTGGLQLESSEMLLLP